MNKKAYFQLLLSLLIFSSLGIIRKNIMMDSTQIIFMRSFIGMISVYLIIKLTGQKIETKNLKGNKKYILLSGMAMGMCWICLFESYKYLDVSLGVLLHYLAPVIIIALSPVIFKEKITISKLIGLLMAITGMVLVNGEPGSSINLKLGIIYGVSGAILYAAQIILSKLVKGVEGLTYMLFQMICAFCFVGVYLVLTQGFVLNIPSFKDLFLLIILGLFHTAIAFYLYYEALRELPAQTAALISYLDPVLALLLAYIILKEKLSYGQMIGATLIILGTMYGQLGDSLRGRKQEG